MTISTTTTSASSRHLGRSVVAVAVGFVAVFILSLGTDELLHVLHVYPPWNQTMYEPGLNFLALSYRIIYTIIGAYITAKLAPQNPMRHAVALGVVGTIVSVGLAIATIPMHLGPSWYPIAIVLTGLPCCWLGGVLYSARHAD